MKKIFTVSLALMASTTMFAQTTLWNGEDGNNPFWQDRCAPQIVDNEKTDGINSSAKCLQFATSGTEWNNGCVGFGLPGGLSFESKRLSLMIRKEFSSNVRAEIEFQSGSTKKVAAWHDGGDGWSKLYFDFSTNGDLDTPKNLVIFPSTGDEAVGKTVYIDNIQIEDAPKVNGTALADCTDLTGNIVLTGAWLKGECQNTDGDWVKVEYNDFATLASKLADGITSIDMRGTVTKDVDVNAMRGDRPNVLVFADEAYSADNVVAGGICKNLVLVNSSAFATPEDFTAESVSVSRPVYSGNNTMCLPFWVSAADLGAKAIATYSNIEEADGQNVVHFVKQEAADANVPFIAQFDADSSDPLTFSDKGVVNTPAEMGTPFTGTYTPGSAAGKYGLNAEGKFQQGGESATIKAFSAFLTLTTEQKAGAILAIDGETTGINAATNKAEAVVVYNLQGVQVATAKSASDLNLASGVYIVNNRKVVIK